MCSFSLKTYKKCYFRTERMSNVLYLHENSIPLHEIYINTSIMHNLNRIKIVLVEQNQTGKWLADQLGKSTCTVSKWCQNTIQPDLKTLNEIANLLKVDVKELLVSNI